MDGVTVGWMEPFASTTDTGDCRCSGVAALSALRVATALVIDTSVVASLDDHSDRIMRQTPRTTTNSSKPISPLRWMDACMHARPRIFETCRSAACPSASHGTHVSPCGQRVAHETNAMDVQTHARWDCYVVTIICLVLDVHLPIRNRHFDPQHPKSAIYPQHLSTCGWMTDLGFLQSARSIHLRIQSVSLRVRRMLNSCSIESDHILSMHKCLS